MNNLELISSSSQNRESALHTASKHGFKLEDSNQEICVIFEKDTKQTVAIIGFNSDAGRNYHEGENVEIHMEHELLYIEEQSFVSKSNLLYLNEIATLASNWLFKYLLKSAIYGANNYSSDKIHNMFQYGVNKDSDDKILNWVLSNMNHKLMEENLKLLGYQNHKYK